MYFGLFMGEDHYSGLILERIKLWLFEHMRIFNKAFEIDVCA
ncbi:hypothetical protein VCHA43P277_80181 [Vibrio chagasii]|nr:hypothetical protein VCHA34P126_260038 [Vibrio chagasii]CAH7127419.1 hypothetical protein VCHA50P420_100039 [Vibrio chagasii]CAH7196542.1 hypothetical protein VCHA41O247_240008 [Vibrio chagasii]CAH7384050.1 hypothetical protein VCHA43P277_80181 [Vibrio chagasii]